MPGLHLKLLSLDDSRDNLMQLAKFISKFVITSNTNVKTVARQGNEIDNYSEINVDVTEAWN
jgi:hypothetical protein